MKSKAKLDPKPLDDEENQLLDSFERGEWKQVKRIKKQKDLARDTASRTPSVLHKYAAGHLHLN